MESANPTTVTQTPARNADQFTKSTYRIFDGVARHRRGFGTLVLWALVLMIIAAVFMGRREKLSGEARNALFVAQKKYDAEMKAMAPPAPKVDPKAKVPPAPPVDETEFKAFDVNAKMP